MTDAASEQTTLTTRERWRFAGAIALLVLVNYVLRHTLEDSHHRMYSFLEYFYKPQLPILFGQLPWWRLFLPLKELTGSWCTTTLILTYLVERVLTPGGAWELFNAAAIVTAAVVGWYVFRSVVVSITVAIAIGFGTQFYHAYAVTGGIASYLLVIYNMLLIGAVVIVVRGDAPRAGWRTVLAVSVLLNVLAYEGWLDVLACLWLATPFLFVMLRRQARDEQAWRLVRVTGILTAVGIAYVVMKVTLGFGQTQGSESDVLFNYRSLWPAIDDLVGNVFTHTYMSVSNFMPPALVGASSFYRLGADYLVNAQFKYHEAFSYLTVLNQVFFWRYYAGVVFAAVVGTFVWVSWRGWRTPASWTLVVGASLLMVLAAAPTHTTVKFRPMNAEPVMTYHVTLGVIGVSVLFGWLLDAAWRYIRNRRVAAAVVLLGWVFIFSSAFTRPPYLAHMAAQAGLGEALYPNPMQELMRRLHLRYTPPVGGAAFQLVRFDPYREASAAASHLGALPNPLPPAAGWKPAVKTMTTVVRPDGTLEVTGDDSHVGYQVVSPVVTLVPERHYLIRPRFDVTAGRVCAGVITADMVRWLAAPDPALAEVAFDSERVTAVRVVLANCNLQTAGNTRSRFLVQGGTFASVAEEGR